MKYVLLLRGVNVGGKNKVSMSELKELMANSGFENVDSYINSGNLFFCSDLCTEDCIPKISHLLESSYNFFIPFALLSKGEYLEERKLLPDWWNKNLPRKDVLFY